MGGAGATMAKKPKGPKAAGKDYHKSGYMVRLPEPLREKLRELVTKTRRAMTVEIQIAVEAHLRANGIEPPK